MRKISYSDYFDKVYGCFLGKCIGGTAGGPAEGRKELLDEPLNEELLHSSLPNDDLDLQILWLELLEERGADITARDMAYEFYHKVPYGPGEYAYFMKNFAAGIYPPVSGAFNNRYYKNGMGCPIRSEVWACLFPGAPELTLPYVKMDGSLDHESDSIDAEYFLAYLESEAFFADGYGEVMPLIEKALSNIPAGTKIHNAISDSVKWYLEGRDWKNTRGMILRKYGHSDCTNLYQNMAMIILALLYGKGDFRETVRLGLACGYDTDCICASAASVLGIFRGGKAILEEDGMTDTGLNIGIYTRRREGSIREFSRDVCAAGMSLADKHEKAAEITERPDFKPLPESVKPQFTVNASYDGDPVLTPDCTKKIILSIKRNIGEGEVALKIDAPEGVLSSLSEGKLALSVGEETSVVIEASVSPDAKILHKCNIFKIKLGEFEDTFGLMGGTVWHRYGPFLMNNEDLTSTVPAYVPYSYGVKADEKDSEWDRLRDYHLNSFADINREFVSEAAPFLTIEEDGRAECEAEVIYTGEDLFDLADIQSYEGPHTDYLVTTLVIPEDREVELAVGHTAPFKLWLNGEYVGMSDRCTWWTCENKHFNVKLKKGDNRLIIKCAQQTDSAKYSIIPRIGGAIWGRQWSDVDSRIK